MATIRTTNALLLKPATADRNWDVQVNANSDALDAGPLGGLLVATKELPSSTLNIRVSAGQFISANGLSVSYAGTASQAVTASVTNYIYLTDAGTLTSSTSGFPVSVAITPLAVVVAGGSTITSVADARQAWRSFGLSQLRVHEGSNTAMGVATLVAGSAVVSNTLVTASSRIFITSQADGGTPGWLRISARTPATSFTITSSSGSDTSTVGWIIVEPL